MRNDAPAPVRGFLKRLADDRKGVIAMVAAIAFPILITLAGFGTELALWYSAKRQMQGVADSAALAAAFGMQAGESNAVYSSEATGIAGYNGFVTGTNNVTVTVNNPPTMGNYTTNNNAVEVIIQQPVSKTLTAALGTASVTLAARAVGGLTATKQSCVLSLGTISVTGASTVTATSCTVAANSAAAGAITLQGSSAVQAQAIESVGTDSVSGTSTFNPAPTVGGAPVADPFATTGFPPPSTISCASPINVPSAPTFTLSPNTCYYAGQLGQYGTFTLAPGPYVFVNHGSTPGSFGISNGSSATGTGVSIFLVSTSAAVCAPNLNLSGSGTLTITAPTAGNQNAGIAIAQYEPSGSTCTPSTNSSGVGGSTSLNVSGLVYLPYSTFSISGAGITSGGNCNILIAASISVSGSGGLSNTGCATYGGSAVFDNIYTVMLLE